MSGDKTPQLKDYSADIRAKLAELAEDVAKVNKLLARFSLTPVSLVPENYPVPDGLRLNFGSRIPTPEIGDLVTRNPRFGESHKGMLKSVADTGIATVLMEDNSEETLIASQLVRVADLEPVKRRNEAAKKAVATRAQKG